MDRLKSSIKNIISKISSAIFVDKKLIDEITKELQRGLLQADVDVEIVLKLTDEIKRIAASEKTSISKKELLIKLIYDKLTEILGKEKTELEFKKKKHQRVMLVGLYGCGKTTTSVKLAFYYKKRGFKVAVVGLDVHRPAAQEQLGQLAEKAGVTYFIAKTDTAIQSWEEVKEKVNEYEIVFIDTAGRHSLDEELKQELKQLYEVIKPNYVILVIPADIGQIAKEQAKGFNKIMPIDGIIVTRMDGSARGGGAITSCVETGTAVIFIGTGEKIKDIEAFDPTRFIARVLGMGDIEGIIEKIKLSIEKETEKKLKKKLEEGKFTLDAFYEQIKALQSVGPLNKLIDLIPGLNNVKLPSSIFQVQEKKMKKWKYIIDSMTPEERDNPEILNASRIQRIAKGASVTASEVREMLKYYKMIRQMIGKYDEKSLSKLARRLGKFRIF